MYEVNLWIRLHENVYDGDSGGQYAKATAIAERVAAWTDPTLAADVRILNGTFTLTLTCHANRRRAHETELIDDLLAEVIRLLPASYGLIYERDDETTEHPGHNAFRVTVLARGKLSIREDPFLSPAYPTIEDPYADLPGEL
ncbi:Imm7 family immunity protein [Kribbella sp. NPDC051770]|uniref:Imm7 family immunity protein n=1 Tax=Kribbella sp. NPDC051770 TaxID=3155413 RepID=UPI00342B4C0A